MPTIMVEDENGRQIPVEWSGPNLPTRDEIPELVKAALAKAPPPEKPFVPRLIDTFRAANSDLQAMQKVAPAFGGELWAAKKAAEFAGAQFAKVRRPVDWSIGQALKMAAERSKARLADPTKRAATEAMFGPGAASGQEEANARRVAAAERLIAGEGTLGTEFQAAQGAPATRGQAVRDTVLRTGIDFATDPSTLVIGGLGKLGRLGSQLQYVLGAALTGTAGLGSVEKAREVLALAKEGKLSSPQAAAAATDSLLSAMMAGFGARGFKEGLTRDSLLAEIERSAKEAASLEATGVGQTPAEIAPHVAALRPYAESMVKRRAEFTANVKELRKEQVAALQDAMAKLEADPTDASAQAVYDSLAKQAARPEIEGSTPPPTPRLTLYRGEQHSKNPLDLNLSRPLSAMDAIDRIAGRPASPGQSKEPFRYYTETEAGAAKYAGQDQAFMEMYKANQKAWGKPDPEAAALDMFRNLHGRDPLPPGTVAKIEAAPRKVLDLSELGEKPEYEPLIKLLEKAEGGKPRDKWGLDEELDISARLDDEATTMPAFRLMRNTKDAPQGAAKFRKWLEDNGYDAVRFAEDGTFHYAFLGEPAAPPPMKGTGGIDLATEQALLGWIGKRGKRSKGDAITAQHALEGLQALLTGAGRDGRPLEHSRKMALLKVFGRDLYKITNEADATIQSTPLWEKVKSNARDILIDSPRALQASADLSATLRQGGIPTVYSLITHPIRTVKDIASAAHAFADPAAYLAAERTIRNNVYDYTPPAGGRQRVNLTELGDRFGLDRSTDLSLNRPAGAQEAVSDYFSEGLAERIPVAGEIVKGSERGYKLYLDTVRHRLWREWDEHLRDMGYTPEKNPQFWKDSAEAINELSGLAKMPKVGGYDLNQAGPLLRAIFFAPRFAYARLKLLGDIATGGARYQSASTKDFLTKYEPVNPVRKQMLKVLGSYGAFYGSLLYALKQFMPGVTVEEDPNSSDFVKIKVGNTRFDVWGGLQQYARFASQSLSGVRKTGSGDEQRIPGAPGDYLNRAIAQFQTGKDLPAPATGKRDPSYAKAMLDFLEGKGSPAFSYIRDVQRGGVDIFGKPADLNPLTRFRPFGYRDAQEAYKDNPAMAAIVAPLGALGIGTQTYAPQTSETPAEREVKELRKEQQPPKPPEKPEKKLERAVSKDMRAEYEVKIRRLVKAGDEIGAYEALMEASLQGFDFPDLEDEIMGYDNEDEE